MLKFAKKLLLIVGALVVIAALFLMLYEWTLSGSSLRNILAAATANNSNPDKAASFSSTISAVWLPVAGTLVGGLVLGLGIGIPSATFKQRYEQRQAEAAQKLAVSDAESPAKA